MILDTGADDKHPKACALILLSASSRCVHRAGDDTSPFGDIPSAAHFLMPYVAPGPDGLTPRVEDLILAIEQAPTQ